MATLEEILKASRAENKAMRSALATIGVEFKAGETADQLSAAVADAAKSDFMATKEFSPKSLTDANAMLKELGGQLEVAQAAFDTVADAAKKTCGAEINGSMTSNEVHAAFAQAVSQKSETMGSARAAQIVARMGGDQPLETGASATPGKASGKTAVEVWGAKLERREGGA